MASKRKTTSNYSNYNNFRPHSESQKWETKGTKPLPNPVSVKEAILMVVIHVCRKILFVNTKIKVGLYMAGLFLSFIFDVWPFPRSYFSKSDNVFNTYFVKMGWGWTLLLTLPFALLTSFTHCCGKRSLILIHLSRLAVATVVWFIFTKSFALIEHSFGKCSVKSEKFTTKEACISKGYYWHSLDISGHAFILIWSSLVIIEEGKAIIGWETIEDLIRNEEHSRSIAEIDLSSPLKQINDDEFRIMKSSFTKFTPIIRALFITMTLLTILWDAMILSTILYFHIMIEKLISGVLAISVWFITYQYWYPSLKAPPAAPGEGLFKYNKSKGSRSNREGPRGRASISSSSSRSKQLPTFMGMPLYGLRTQESKEETAKDENVNIEADDMVNKTNATSSRTKSLSNQWQSLPRQGIVTRSQTLSSTQKNNANKTI